MVIDKIGDIGRIFRPGKTEAAKSKTPAKGASSSDTVSISKEALQAQETAKINNIVRQAPDVRAEKVQQIKQKMASGEYDKMENEILERVAEKIAQALVRK